MKLTVVTVERFAQHDSGTFRLSGYPGKWTSHLSD